MYRKARLPLPGVSSQKEKVSVALSGGIMYGSMVIVGLRGESSSSHTRMHMFIAVQCVHVMCEHVMCEHVMCEHVSVCSELGSSTHTCAS